MAAQKVQKGKGRMRYLIEGTVSNMYLYLPFRVTVSAENREQARSKGKRKVRRNLAMGLTIEIKDVKEEACQRSEL